MRTPESPKTLYDKIFDEHVVRMEEDGTATLYIDRHLVHEVTSAQAFEGLRMNNRPLWRKSSIVATADHNTPTTGWEAGMEGITDPISKLQVTTLDENIRQNGCAAFFPFLSRGQGVIHVMGPEEGATLPGMTVVCGDSHTSTHGACAAIAFGIGTSEVEHVMATQTLLTKKMKTCACMWKANCSPAFLLRILRSTLSARSERPAEQGAPLSLTACNSCALYGRPHDALQYGHRSRCTLRVSRL